MSRRKIDKRVRVKKARHLSPPIWAKVAAKREITRAEERDKIREVIHEKKFDMNRRYDPAYCAKFAREIGMTPGRFKRALDYVIRDAWRNLRNGKVKPNPSIIQAG